MCGEQCSAPNTTSYYPLPGGREERRGMSHYAVLAHTHQLGQGRASNPDQTKYSQLELDATHHGKPTGEVPGDTPSCCLLKWVRVLHSRWLLETLGLVSFWAELSSQVLLCPISQSTGPTLHRECRCRASTPPAAVTLSTPDMPTHRVRKKTLQPVIAK